jgi:tripartite-type tricarboxylate transporter receptor subunit TctC
MKMRFNRRVATVALALVAVNPALAADPFPSKPIRIVVTSAPGGLLDMTTRFVAQKLGDRLGQQVVVENRVGAGGLLAIRSVKSAPADGYTLLATPNTVAIQQALSRDPGYDVEKDFVGVGPMTRAPLLLVTGPDAPDKSMAALLARGKADPGKLTYGSAGVGTSTHLGAASFAQRAALNLVHVPYKGNPAAWPDLISGRLDMLFEPYGSGASMINGGKLKALGVASTKRLEVLPDVPTFAEQGVPNFSAYSWFGLLAPVGTPKEAVARLGEALRSVMTSAELRERVRSEGSEAMLMSPEEFNDFLKREVAAVGQLVSDLGLPKE